MLAYVYTQIYMYMRLSLSIKPLSPRNLATQVAAWGSWGTGRVSCGLRPQCLLPPKPMVSTLRPIDTQQSFSGLTQ